MNAATGNERWPTIAIDDMMRMSIDVDNQRQISNTN